MTGLNFRLSNNVLVIVFITRIELAIFFSFLSSLDICWWLQLKAVTWLVISSQTDFRSKEFAIQFSSLLKVLMLLYPVEIAVY